jgi:hypothetical protein
MRNGEVAVSIEPIAATGRLPMRQPIMYARHTVTAPNTADKERSQDSSVPHFIQRCNSLK